MAVLAQDGFSNHTILATINGTNLDTGKTWVDGGTSTANIQITTQGNACFPRSITGVNTCASVTGISATDYFVEASIQPTLIGTGNLGGVIARWTNSANYYFAGLNKNASGQMAVQLFKNSMTTVTQLAVATSVSNKVALLRLNAQGKFLTVFWDGQQLFKSMDSTFSSGSAGLFSNFTSQGTNNVYLWDNFLVDGAGIPPPPNPVGKRVKKVFSNIYYETGHNRIKSYWWQPHLMRQNPTTSGISDDSSFFSWF